MEKRTVDELEEPPEIGSALRIDPSFLVKLHVVAVVVLAADPLLLLELDVAVFCLHGKWPSDRMFREQNNNGT